jgi:hypothetical protein
MLYPTSTVPDSSGGPWNPVSGVRELSDLLLRDVQEARRLGNGDGYAGHEA